MHPSVVEVGCIGVPDAQPSQAVEAYVVAHETLTAEELREFCRKYMTAYKVPKYIDFRDTLAKTNIGKTLRVRWSEETPREASDHVTHASKPPKARRQEHP